MLSECLKTGNIEIDAFEKKYGVKLPSDYKQFLTKYNGVISKDETMIFVHSMDSELEIESLFGLQLERDWLSIEYWMNEYQDELPDQTIIIGCDLLKGLFVYITTETDRGIYYWDHTFSFPMSSEKSNAYFICQTFDEFLDLIGGIQEG